MASIYQWLRNYDVRNVVFEICEMFEACFNWVVFTPKVDVLEFKTYSNGMCVNTIQSLLVLRFHGYLTWSVSYI